MYWLPRIDKHNEHKIVNIFLPISFKYVFGAQKNRVSERESCFEYLQHIFWLRNKKISFLEHTPN